jgi:hypothetical protein
MRLDLRNYDTGWGELLCFVAAWAVGLGAVWIDSHSGPQPTNKVAASSVRPIGALID